jgi:hypothetical protein
MIVRKYFVAMLALLMIGTSSCTSSSGSEGGADDLADDTEVSVVPDNGSETTPDVTTPSPSAGLPLADGETYTQIVTPVNCLVKRGSEYEEANRSQGDELYASALEGYQEIYGDIAEARVLAAGELLKYSWPDAIEASIVSMSQFWFGIAKYEEALALAPDLEAWNTRMAQYREAGVDPTTSGLSSMIRQALGLPNNGADYVATLKCS